MSSDFNKNIIFSRQLYSPRRISLIIASTLPYFVSRTTLGATPSCIGYIKAPCVDGLETKSSNLMNVLLSSLD